MTVALLFLPMLQILLSFITVAKLGGYEPIPANVEFEKTTWLDGTYQDGKEKYLKTHFGFRNWALRLDHQVAYSVYNKSKVHAVVIGKENYLFDYDYILEHNGKFPVKEFEINTRLNRLVELQDTLKKLGKHLMVVIGPNKADFFPEYLPDEDQIPREGLKTNYDYYIKGMRKRNINLVDANGWFLAMKGKTAYGCANWKQCNFRIPDTFMGRSITENLMLQLVGKSKTSNSKSWKNDGEKLEGIAILNDRFELEFVPKVTAPMPCPKCKKGTLIKGKQAYGCSEWKSGCNVVLPFAYAEKSLSEQQVRQLVANGRTKLIKGFLIDGKKENGFLTFDKDFKFQYEKSPL